MAAKPETNFKKRIRPFLEELPHSWWFKTQMIALRGIPDVLGCLNGHFIALELKISGETPDELQGWVLRKVKAAGGFSATVTPENWVNIFKTLQKMAHGPAIGREPLPRHFES